MTLSKKDDCDEARIQALVKDNIEGAQDLTDVAGEMSFRLPVCLSLRYLDVVTVPASMCVCL